MAKKRTRTETWKEEPEEHDFPAAADYLSLLLAETSSAPIIEALRVAGTMKRKAKDLMRASGLPLLPIDDPEVAKNLKRVEKGERFRRCCLCVARPRPAWR
jgi:hypothetical protein